MNNINNFITYELELQISRIIHLMFQDEASIGRIYKRKHCWCRKGNRTDAPDYIREHDEYMYGSGRALDRGVLDF